MSQSDKNAQLDETVWQAWLNKNKVQERMRYEMRLRVMILVGVFVITSAVLWKFALTLGLLEKICP